jgi:hypothetical protein
MNACVFIFIGCAAFVALTSIVVGVMVLSATSKPAQSEE